MIEFSLKSPYHIGCSGMLERQIEVMHKVFHKKARSSITGFLKIVYSYTDTVNSQWCNEIGPLVVYGEKSKEDICLFNGVWQNKIIMSLCAKH